MVNVMFFSFILGDISLRLILHLPDFFRHPECKSHSPTNLSDTGNLPNKMEASEKRGNGELMMIHQCLLCWKMYTGWRKEGSGI